MESGDRVIVPVARSNISITASLDHSIARSPDPHHPIARSRDGLDVITAA
jgi:hypothetical protein